MRFYENELLVYTRCSCSRISAPKIYPKINEKNGWKMEHFHGPLLDGLGSHSVIILESKSHLKIDEKINAILYRFLVDFEPILGSIWGFFGVRISPGRSQDAPRRSQDTPKMLPKAQGRLQGTPRRPKRAQHASKLDFERFFIEFSMIFHRYFH